MTCNGPSQSSRFKLLTAFTKVEAAVGGRKSSAVSKTQSTNKVSLLTKIGGGGVHRSSADSHCRWGVHALKNSRNRGSSESSHPPPSHNSGYVTGSRGAMCNGYRTCIHPRATGISRGGGGSNKSSGPGSRPHKVSQARGRRALHLRDLWAYPPALRWRASRDSGSGHTSCPSHTEPDGMRPAPLRCNTHRHLRASRARL